MRWPPLATFATCVIVLHTPGGGELHIDTRHMNVWQPLASEGHVAPGTKSIVNSGAQRFAVIETVQEIDEMRDRCGEE